jgi:SagB-type dehydrogenase family enzyme
MPRRSLMLPDHFPRSGDGTKTSALTAVAPRSLRGPWRSAGGGALGASRPALSLLLLAALCALACRTQRPSPEVVAEPPPAPEPAPAPPAASIALPAPALSGELSLEQVLFARRSQRQFAATPLPVAELGQLAWAAQGVTEPGLGYRSCPSAGALYPLELYFVTPDGAVHYRPATHSLKSRSSRDLRESLSQAANGQTAVRRAACDIVITSVTERTRDKYGERASRYVAMEAGHAGQNLLLQATARGLVGVPVGAFDDAAVSRVLELPAGEEPLYIIALGYPPETAAH